MNEERVEELLRERGHALDGPVLPADVEARVRAELAAEAAGAASALPWWKRRSVLLPAAAVAVALVLGYVLRGPGRPVGLEAEVATLESAALVAEYRTLYGLDAARLPDLDRSSSDPDVPPAEEVVAYAAEAEERAIEEALDSGAPERVAAWYKVAFRPSAECSAVVLEIDARAIREVYPGEAGRDRNRFSAGRAYVLPGPSVRVLVSELRTSWSYDGGFVRPASVDRLVVLLGLRSDPLDDAFDTELARFSDELDPAETADARAARLTEWLEESGFFVRRHVVRAP